VLFVAVGVVAHRGIAVDVEALAGKRIGFVDQFDWLAVTVFLRRLDFWYEGVVRFVVRTSSLRVAIATWQSRTVWRHVKEIAALRSQ